MKKLLKGLAISVGLLAAALATARAAESARPVKTPEAFEKEIAALQAPKVAWRAIAWKNCLLEGLKEARARKKPALLWVFIDRPADDARC
jgi:hypothetical protein